MVQELLEAKTFNDTSLYTDKTTAEILQEIEISKNLEINTLSGTLNKHDDKFWLFAKLISGTIIVVSWCALVTLFVILKYVDYSNWSNIWKILLNSLSIIPTLWGLMCWIGVIKQKSYLLNFLTKKICKRIKKWFDK